MFRHDGTDTNGEQRMRQAMLGCAPAQDFFSLVKTEMRSGTKAPRAFDDYAVEFDPESVPKGVSAQVYR